MEDVMRLVLALAFSLAILLVMIMFFMGFNINIKGGWITALVDAIRFLFKPIV
jgi:hypothetical protein